MRKKVCREANMKEKSIVKKAGVLLFAVLMIVSTATVMAKSNTQPTATDNDVWLGYTGDSPQLLRGDVWVGYDDGEPEKIIGSNAPPLFIAIRLSPDELAPYDGLQFLATTWYCAVYNASIPNHNYDMKIWEGNETAPITMLLNESDVAQGEGWANHTIAAPITINAAKNYWIMIKCYAFPAGTYNDYPLGYDTNNYVPGKSDWYHNNNYPETGFYELSGTSIGNGSWCLRVKVEVPAPALEIASLTGGFGIKAGIKNAGDAAATNVDWNITLNGGLIILGKLSEGTIASITAGATEQVKSKFILGFGKTVVTVNALCDEGSYATKSTNATVFLVFVLGIK